jgi:hypothetical protein
MTNESLAGTRRAAAGSQPKGPGLLRWILWFLLVSFWAAWGLCVAAFVLIPDPRRLYNYLIGRIDDDDALLGVTKVANPQLSRYVLAILFVAAIIYFSRRWWQRTAPQQTYPMWYALYGLLVAIPLGLAFSLATPIDYVLDYRAYLNLAKSLYDTGTYLDISEGSEVPDVVAWRPPGVALLVGLPIYFGVPAQLAVWLVNSAIALAVFFCIRRILGPSARAPLLPIAIFGVLIALITLPFMVLPIAHLPGIVIILVLLLLVSTDSRVLVGMSWLRWFFAGVLIGIGALFRTNLIAELVILAGVILLVWWRSGGGRWKAAPLAALLACALGTAVAIAPWTVRNWFALHRFVLVSTYGGMVFYSANGSPVPWEQGHYIPRLAIDLHESFPNEVDREHAGWRRGLSSIAAHPIAFVESFVYRIPRTLANPIFPISYIRDHARNQNWTWILVASEAATLIGFWGLWLFVLSRWRRIRARTFDPKEVPWPQLSLLVTVLAALIFNNIGTFQLSYLAFILFICFDAWNIDKRALSNPVFQGNV